jgi:hypothetical protein
MNEKMDGWVDGREGLKPVLRDCLTQFKNLAKVS